MRKLRLVRKFVVNLMAGGCALVTLAAHAQTGAAGAPLPRCAPSENAFYLMRFKEHDPALMTLTKVSVTGVGESLTLAEAPQWADVWPGTVAAGMNPKDGYIYGIRAVSGDKYDAQTPAYYQDFRAFQVVRYGATGAENLGVIDASNFPMTSSTPPHSIYDPSPNPNFNAADFDPKTGLLIVGMLRDGGYRGNANYPQQNTLLRIDVTVNPPKLVSVLTLKQALPSRKSGDFAIDATGTYAYGIATGPSGTGYPLTWWRADLTTGDVITKSFGSGNRDFGAAAALPDGNFAFYSNEDGRVTVVDADGNELSADNVPTSDSSDATRCLPAPVVTLTCTPTALVDSEGNESVCTVTSDQAAPTGGLSVAIALPGSNRYTSTCVSPLIIPENETTATCTITAVPNTVVGDGDVVATLTVLAGEGYAPGDPASAEVTIADDDKAVTTAGPTPIPTLSEWALILLSLGIAGFAARRRLR